MINKLKEYLLERKRQSIIRNTRSYINQKHAMKTFEPGKDWVQYSGPYFDGEVYSAGVGRLIDEWLIYGERAREFEVEFAPHLGKKHGSLTNSGSSANLLMMSVLKSNRLKSRFNLRRGDQFITPVVCFPTTINPMLQNGFEPVFVDVELPNLHPNLDQVEKLLEKDRKKKNPKIKGITFAHVLGNPPDMERLMDIINKYELIFLEDACDALGSTWKGKPLGSFGLMSTCSFFPAHHMSMGEGGFIATDDNQIRIALAATRDWGRACYCNTNKPGNVTEGTACGNRFSNWFKDAGSQATFDHRYVFDEVGYNLKPLDMQAAMGLQQIKKLPEMHAKRKLHYFMQTEIWGKYSDRLMLPTKMQEADPSWFGFLLTVKDDSPVSKAQMISKLEDAKIQTRSYFTGNALLHPAYADLRKKYKDVQKAFPVATKVTNDTFFLGVWPGALPEHFEHIKNTAKEIME